MEHNKNVETKIQEIRQLTQLLFQFDIEAVTWKGEQYVVEKLRSSLTKDLEAGNGWPTLSECRSLIKGIQGEIRNHHDRIRLAHPHTAYVLDGLWQHAPRRLSHE